jgi:hypothetical protein
MPLTIDDLISYKPYDAEQNRLIDFSAVGCSKDLYENFRKVSVRTISQSDISNLQEILHDKRYSKFIFKEGVYEIDNVININRSNIAIEGYGEVTLILNNKDSRPFSFTSNKWYSAKQPQVNILSNVPVGSFKVELQSTNAFSINDRVIIGRVGNQKWIETIGMDYIPPDPNGTPSTPWKPFNLEFDRVVKGIEHINGKTILTLNAPIACAIESKWGGGYVYKYTNARNMNIVVKNLTIKTTTEKAIAIYVDNVENMLVDKVTSLRSDILVSMERGTKNNTVKNCTYLDPMAPIAGGNRSSYYINGQLILVTQCKADNGRHSYVVGSRIPGLIVFHRCKSTNDRAASEPHHRWSVGGLYDNVEGSIKIQNRLSMGGGHGWSGANYITWNCTGSMVCQKPPTANNFCVGQIGTIEQGSFKNQPQGTFISIGKKVIPESLYEYQLQQSLQQ